MSAMGRLVREPLRWATNATRQRNLQQAAKALNIRRSTRIAPCAISIPVGRYAVCMERWRNVQLSNDMRFSRLHAVWSRKPRRSPSASRPEPAVGAVGRQSASIPLTRRATCQAAPKPANGVSAAIDFIHYGVSVSDGRSSLNGALLQIVTASQRPPRDPEASQRLLDALPHLPRSLTPLPVRHDPSVSVRSSGLAHVRGGVFAK